MRTESALRQGSTEWFEMVGTMMCDAALQSGLPPHLTVSLVERYSDGVALSAGLVQGLRFAITGGVPSFRVGVRDGEQADVTITVTAAAARALNTLYSADPEYSATVAMLVSAGALRVDGDPARLGDWLETAHDPIVARTI